MLDKENAEIAGFSCFGDLLFCSVVYQCSQRWRKQCPFYVSCKSEWNEIHQVRWAAGESRFATYVTKICGKVLVALPATKPTDLAECSTLFPVPWKRCLSGDWFFWLLHKVPSPPAVSWLPVILVSSRSSGSFPSAFEHAQISASLKNKQETIILLHVLPLLFVIMIFLSDLNSLAPLPCLPFNQTFI